MYIYIYTECAKLSALLLRAMRWMLACAAPLLRSLLPPIDFVAWSFVVAFVVGLATLPGTPRYRRTRRAVRRQGKALYIVRPPTHAPTTKRQPIPRADVAPTHRLAHARHGTAW